MSSAKLKPAPSPQFTFGTTSILRYVLEQMPGREVLKGVSDAVLKDRSSVVALDLFFWDSVLTNPAESVSALNHLIAQTRQVGIPLVLGEIPELLPGRQATRGDLNAAMRASCLTEKNCFIMPFDEIHRQLMKDGFIEFRGRRMTLRDIVPDGLHLSGPASEFFADRLESVLLQKPSMPKRICASRSKIKSALTTRQLGGLAVTAGALFDDAQPFCEDFSNPRQDQWL